KTKIFVGYEPGGIESQHQDLRDESELFTFGLHADRPILWHTDRQPYGIVQSHRRARTQVGIQRQRLRAPNDSGHCSSEYGKVVVDLSVVSALQVQIATDEAVIRI